MGQSIDCQPHFGHQMRRRKASYANHAAQGGRKNGGLPSLRQAARAGYASLALARILGHRGGQIGSSIVVPFLVVC